MFWIGLLVGLVIGAICTVVAIIVTMGRCLPRYPG